MSRRYPTIERCEVCHTPTVARGPGPVICSKCHQPEPPPRCIDCGAELPSRRMKRCKPCDREARRLRNATRMASHYQRVNPLIRQENTGTEDLADETIAWLESRKAAQ